MGISEIPGGPQPANWKPRKPREKPPREGGALASGGTWPAQSVVRTGQFDGGGAGGFPLEETRSEEEVIPLSES